MSLEADITTSDQHVYGNVCVLVFWHKLVKVGIFRSIKQVASENQFGKI